MRKILILVIALSLLLSGCGIPAVATQQKQYKATFMSLFDTVTTIVGSAESETFFYDKANEVYEELEEYHQLFDIYNEYEGIVNLKTINDQAGIAPVKVDERIIRLLQDCKDMYEMTDGRVNVAMGSVLSLWHEAREHGRSNPKEASLPPMQALREAAGHMDPEVVLIDAEASTVYIQDPLVQLDVGAIAKGWSVQRVAENAPEGMLISVGGNVCVTGAKDPMGTPWVIGIQDPSNENEFLHTVYVKEGSVVTSGDYQRTYQVDGKMYHHIIDPDTLYPAEYWRSITVLCQDSGVADALSTALFLVSQEDGQQLLEQYRAEAMWVAFDGEIIYSPGFKKYISKGHKSI